MADASFLCRIIYFIREYMQHIQQGVSLVSVERSVQVVVRSDRVIKYIYGKGDTAYLEEEQLLQNRPFYDAAAKLLVRHTWRSRELCSQAATFTPYSMPIHVIAYAHAAIEDLPVMRSPMLAKAEALPDSLILRGLLHFSPAWFSVTMGTGVIGILLHSSPLQFRLHQVWIHSHITIFCKHDLKFSCIKLLPSQKAILPAKEQG